MKYLEEREVGGGGVEKEVRLKRYKILVTSLQDSFTYRLQRIPLREVTLNYIYSYIPAEKDT